MILNEHAQSNGHGANGIKKPATMNGDAESGSRYWGKRYIPNQGESFEVSRTSQIPNQDYAKLGKERSLTTCSGGQDAIL